MLKILKAFLKLFSLVGIIFWLLANHSFSLKAGENVKWIVIEKTSKTLVLYQNGKKVGSFPCSFGLNPLIPKIKKGDLATPEGLYRVTYKRPSRKYYLFVGLNYPNLKDIRKAFWEGRLTKKGYQRYLEAYRAGKTLDGPLGNQIGIHGGGLYRKGQSRSVRNWTHGCIALDNQDMERIYRFVEPGTPVLIYNRGRPFFEIMSELVVPELIKNEGWQGQLSLFLTKYSLEIEMLLSARRDGGRTIEIVGIEPFSGQPLFYIRDLNGNGALEPLDRFYSRMKGLPGGYRFIQSLILDELPGKVLNLIKSPGSALKDGAY